MVSVRPAFVHRSDRKKDGSNNSLKHAGIVVLLCPDYLPHSGLVPKKFKKESEKRAVFRQKLRGRNNGKSGGPKGPLRHFSSKKLMFSKCLRTLVNVMKYIKNVNGLMRKV